MVINDPLHHTIIWNFNLRYGNRLAGLNDSEIMGLLWRDLYLRIKRNIKLYNTHIKYAELYYNSHQGNSMKERS